MLMPLLQARPPCLCSLPARELLQVLPLPRARSRRVRRRRVEGRLLGRALAVAQRRMRVAARCRLPRPGRASSASSASPRGLASELQSGKWGSPESTLRCAAPERSSGKCGPPYGRARCQCRMSKAPCRLPPHHRSPAHQGPALGGHTTSAILLRARPAFSQGWLSLRVASSQNLMVMRPTSPLVLRHAARPRPSWFRHP